MVLIDYILRIHNAGVLADMCARKPARLSISRTGYHATGYAATACAACVRCRCRSVAH